MDKKTLIIFTKDMWDGDELNFAIKKLEDAGYKIIKLPSEYIEHIEIL